MIDIHAHIIFGVDDGPANIEESLALLRVSYNQGVRVIIATSHRHPRLFQAEEQEIIKRFEQLVVAAQTLFPDLILLYGAELYYTRKLVSKLEGGELPTLNQTRLILVEWPIYATKKDIYSAIKELCSAGYIPIMAHVERYDSLAFQREVVEELIRLGAYIQVNSSHLLLPRWFGQHRNKANKRAWYLLKYNLVHVVASDMHNLKRRPPFMNEAYNAVTKKYSKERAEDLFVKWAEEHLGVEKSVTID